MTDSIKGQRYWERGDPQHIWVVQSVTERGRDGLRYAVLSTEIGNAEREVEVGRLQDRDYYTPVPPDPRHIDLSSSTD
ncbi:MAG: hypothetical protein U5P41_08755 [Gammaproteobacteria bacterium]|nr:hypothetical protein [Gammaproteobacteria bacterium]